MNVQVVDYREPDASRKFTRSIRETGFAVISHHPISAELIHDSFAEWEAFFRSEGKTRYLFDPERQSGFFPFKSENAKDSKIKDLKEFYHYYPWGELPEQARVHTPRIYRMLTTLGSELLGWIEANTPSEVSRNFSMPLSRMIDGSQESLLRPIHYPPFKGDEEPGAIRAAAHEDINLITLLPAATAPGLQVKDLSGHWHDVSCDTGTIAINSGDMLKLASDGYFPSTTHRVVNPAGGDTSKPRFSMPLFLHPGKDVRLSREHTAGSYLRERLLSIGLIKK